MVAILLSAGWRLISFSMTFVMLMVSPIVSSSSFSLSIIYCIVFTIDSFIDFLMSRKFSGIEKSRWHFEFWGIGVSVVVSFGAPKLSTFPVGLGLFSLPLRTFGLGVSVQ